MSNRVIFPTLIVGLLFFGCGDEVSKKREVKSSNLMKPYKMYGKWYYPKRDIVGKKIVGIVSWYGKEFQGKLTASGEPFNMYDPTAAHKTLPMNTMLYVKNLDNGKSTIVRVNDRGPFTKNRELLLSKRAGQEIGIIDRGIAKAEIIILGYDGHIDQKILAKLQNEEKKENKEKEEKQTKQVETSEEKNSSKTTIAKIVPIVQGTFQGTEIIENPIFSAKKEENIIESIVSPSNKKESNISNSADVEVLEVVEENISNSNFLNNRNLQDTNSSTETNSTDSNSSKSSSSKIEDDEVEEVTNLVITPKPKPSRYIKKHYVQVASFKNQDRAENFIIQKKDILPDGLSLQIRYEMGLYRIWVEGFKDIQEARKFNDEKKYFPSSFLVIRDEKVEQ